MSKNKGFTLLEASIVIFLIGIMAAYAVPNIIDWRANANLIGSVKNLVGDLQMAKIRAIKENHSVVIDFSATENDYLIFVDNGEGVGGIEGDMERNGAERLVRHRELPAGVTFFDINYSGDHVRFTSRGRSRNGNVKLINSAGKMRQVGTSNTGKIQVVKLS